VFRDIEMRDVKNALIISEYYPAILPPDQEDAKPVTRLTPHFHDITLENVTATGSETAAVIVGLPEAPIMDVHLHNVHLSANKGATIGYADVTEDDFVVQASEGRPIVMLAGAKAELH